MKVMEKIIGIAIFVISVFMLVNGIINSSIGHILFSVIGLFAGVAVFWWCLIENSPIHDEKTNRFYWYVKDTGSPHHAPCKNCGERARLIYTFVGKKYLAKKLYGTDCMFCHYTIWFDLWKEED